MKSDFLVKHTFIFFIFNVDLNVKHHLFFQIRTMIYRKKYFMEKNMKKLLNCMLYTHDVTCNLNRWNNAGNDIYKKDH